MRMRALAMPTAPAQPLRQAILPIGWQVTKNCLRHRHSESSRASSKTATAMCAYLSCLRCFDFLQRLVSISLADVARPAPARARLHVRESKSISNSDTPCSPHAMRL